MAFLLHDEISVKRLRYFMKKADFYLGIKYIAHRRKDERPGQMSRHDHIRTHRGRQMLAKSVPPFACLRVHAVEQLTTSEELIELTVTSIQTTTARPPPLAVCLTHTYSSELWRSLYLGRLNDSAV